MKDILKRKVSVGLVAVMLVSQTPVTAFAAEMPEFKTEQLKTENLISEPTEDEPAEAEEILFEDVAGALSAQEVPSDENPEPGEGTESEVVENEESTGEDGYTEVSTWSDLQTQFSAGGNVKLTSDVTAVEGDSALEIPWGKEVTLDLAGYTINANNKFGVIKVNGNLTLTDNSTGKTGKLTGGKADRGGGVFVTVGTFTMSGGTITGCSASQGGGVCVYSGTFNMNGGTIKACNTKSGGLNPSGGGGVFVDSGKFTMSGGTITDCFEPAGICDNTRGGGVCVFGNGEFTMSGGTISGCSTKNPDGAVYVYSNGKFNASGAPVIKDNTWGYGNSANYANNVLFQGGSIHVTGALTEGAEIWVKAVKGATVAVPGEPSGSGTSYTITAADAACFHGDDGLIGELNNGNVVLMLALPKVTLSNANDKAYDGEAFEPQISFEGKTLTKDSDYTINYKKVVDTQETPLSAAPKDAGSYRLVVTGIGDYRGMQTADFTIKKAVIEPANVAAPTAKDDLTYTGQSLQLITAGSVSGNIGAMQYALGSDASTVPASGWSKTVPAGKDAGTYYVWYKITGDNNHKDVAAVSLNGIEIAKADYTNKTVSGNTKYGLSGTIELKNNIAPGGSLGTMTVSDTQEVLDGAPTLSGTVLSYKFKSLSENVGKAARVTVSVNNATNHKDYEVTATLNVINCDHLHTELRNIKEANCTEKGCKGDLYCKDCGSLIQKGEEIPVDPDNHDYHLINTVADPSSPTGEVKTFTCSRCGRSYNDPEINTPVKDENGNTKKTVKVGGVQVEEIVTDKDTGKETVNTKVWINGLEPSYTYTGSAIKPEFKVYDGTKLLTERTDYTVSFKNNKEVGDATVEIKFKGNYKDTKAEKLGFTISKAELGIHIIAHATAVAEKKSAQKPVPVLTWAATGKTVSSKNFDISYNPSTVKAAGEYTATITPKSGSGSKNYGGSTTAKIVVTTKDKLLSNAKVTFDKKSYAYTGSAVTPKYSLKLDGRTLTENTDYRLKDICNNTAPGTATVIFEGNGSYVGTKTVTFKIAGKIELTDSTDFTYTYNASVPFVKSGAKPAVSVRDNRNNVALKEGTDYTVSYSKNKSTTGTPTIRIKGKGNYKGTVYRTFTITQQNISNLTIVASDQFVKKSKLKKATVTIYDKDGNKLSSGKDFIVGANGTPVGDDNTGTVTVSITGSGNYTGDTTATFRYLDSSANINKAGLKNKIADQSYTGNEVKLSYADLTNVLYTGKKSSPQYLVPGTDFEIISYQNNIKRGTAKVVLKGKGSYAGTKTLSFRIVQRKVDYTGKI